MELSKLRLDKIFDWRPGQGPTLNLQIFVHEFRIGKITNSNNDENGEEEASIEIEEKVF